MSIIFKFTLLVPFRLLFPNSQSLSFNILNGRFFDTELCRNTSECFEQEEKIEQVVTYPYIHACTHARMQKQNCPFFQLCSSMPDCKCSNSYHAKLHPLIARTRRRHTIKFHATVLGFLAFSFGRKLETKRSSAPSEDWILALHRF